MKLKSRPEVTTAVPVLDAAQTKVNSVVLVWSTATDDTAIPKLPVATTTIDVVEATAALRTIRKVLPEIVQDVTPTQSDTSWVPDPSETTCPKATAAPVCNELISLSAAAKLLRTLEVVGEPDTGLVASIDEAMSYPICWR